MIIIAAIALIAFIVSIYFVTRPTDEAPMDIAGDGISVSSSLEQGKVNIIEEIKNDINVLVSDDRRSAYPKVRATVYLGNMIKNPNSVDCSLVYPVERHISEEYDSDMINAMRALLEPITESEKSEGYVSLIPAGTSLKYLKLDDTGVMSVNLSGPISMAAGSCAVTAIRSQITETISQFAAVKDVIICIDDNCSPDRILQP